MYPTTRLKCLQYAISVLMVGLVVGWVVYVRVVVYQLDQISNMPGDQLEVYALDIQSRGA